jgi:hypothetical protein
MPTVRAGALPNLVVEVGAADLFEIDGVDRAQLIEFSRVI